MKKLNIAIIGQGRSGKDIHGLFYRSESNKFFNIKYVVELEEALRNEALTLYPGCQVFSNYRDLFDKTDIDLVVNDTFSNLHYEITKDLIEHGFNVLTEKPFARTRFDCDTLAKLAKDKGVLLTCFQQTMFAPYYQHLLQIVKDKVIGEPLQISIRYNGFSRRWDWQTLQKRMAGNAYNTGPHPFGVALGLVDFDKNAKVVYSSLKTSQMSSGDSDDYCKVIIATPNKPLIDIEINNTDAYNDGYCVKIQGTKGTYKTDTDNWEYTYIKEGENVPRPVVENSLCDEEGKHVYCGEELIKHTESGVYNGNAFDEGTRGLYENLYYVLTEGKPLYVTMDMVGDIIGVIETIHAQNPLTIKF